MQENNIFENVEAEGEQTTPPQEEIKTEQPVFTANTAPNYSYVQYVPYGFTPKTFEEKKGIKKASNVLSISLIVMSAISFLWSFAYIFIMSSLGFSINKAYEIINEPAVLQVLQIILSSFLFTVPFIFIYKLGGYRISDLIPLKKPQKENRLALLLFGVSFCSFANIAVSYFSSIFEAFGINYEVDYGEDPKGFFGFMLSLIATVLVPALVEEFACRGLMLGSLKKYGEGFAVLTSSIMFGIMHGNFEQMPFAFLVGLILGFITVKSGSLWIAVAVHGFNNFISVFFSYFMNSFSDQTQNVIYVCYLTLSLILGILAICLLGNTSGEFFNFKKSDTEATEKNKYKWFFTTPLVIIYIVIEFLMSLTFFK